MCLWSLCLISVSVNRSTNNICSFVCWEQTQQSPGEHNVLTSEPSVTFMLFIHAFDAICVQSWETSSGLFEESEQPVVPWPAGTGHFTASEGPWGALELTSARQRNPPRPRGGFVTRDDREKNMMLTYSHHSFKLHTIILPPEGTIYQDRTAWVDLQRHLGCSHFSQ